IELWINAGTLPCASIEISQKRRDDEEGDCSAKLGEICEIACGSYPKIEKYRNNIWNCFHSLPASQTSSTFETCNVECKGNTILRGTDTVTCMEKGWTVSANNRTTFFPICLDEDNVVRKLILVMKEIVQEIDGFLFLIDTSGYVSNTEWTPFQIINSITQMYPLSLRLPLGLLVFHQNVEIIIPYNATNTCKVLQQIKDINLSYSKSNDQPSAYYKALTEAQTQISDFRHRSRTLIFFITDRNSNDESYDKIATTLKDRHVIFSIDYCYTNSIIIILIIQHLRNYKIHSQLQ
ncbi:hypothetical protein ILUMI_12170, partial [Ignelater luminosus]